MTLLSKARALYDAVAPWLGAHRADEVQDALRRELARMMPVWTADKPITAGWYWYKAPGIGDPKLVWVDNGRIDSKLMADLGPPNNLVDVNRIKGEWAGPLEPPQ